ncbi:MAG: cytidylate kinase family protein [Candidatus Woykebacteria bacterium]
MASTYRNIVVSGDVGTGTSTLTKGLAEKLGWEYLSAGNFFRKYFIEHNIPLWNKAAIPNSVENEIDYDLYEKMAKNEHIVFDGHYGAWFARDLPDVYRVLLICDKSEATKRILEREHTHKETKIEIEKRRVQLREKFKKLYSEEDYEDPGLFHLIIDTTNKGPEETIKEALENFKTLSK